MQKQQPHSLLLTKERGALLLLTYVIHTSLFVRRPQLVAFEGYYCSSSILAFILNLYGRSASDMPVFVCLLARQLPKTIYFCIGSKIAAIRFLYAVSMTALHTERKKLFLEEVKILTS